MAQKKEERKRWTETEHWLNAPLEKLPRDEVRKWLDGYQNVLAELDVAARRERCDWDQPIREERDRFMVIFVSELQSSRNAVRLVALRARLAIAEKRYDDALASLRTGYTLARDMAESHRLIGSLVGLTMAGMMTNQVEALQSSPGAPSLYWALAAMPQPLISLCRTIGTEPQSLYLLFPEMEPAKRRARAPDAAKPSRLNCSVWSGVSTKENRNRPKSGNKNGKRPFRRPV